LWCRFPPAEHEFALSAEALKGRYPARQGRGPQFPDQSTGGTMTRAEWLKIADVLLRHNLLVIPMKSTPS
jgi:hypothetical protein